MKKILSYILIFVVVFVNLFAPFSVGIKNNEINLKNNIALATGEVVQISVNPKAEESTLNGYGVGVNGYFKTDKKDNSGSVVYFIGKDKDNYTNDIIFDEKLEDSTVTIKNESGTDFYYYNFGQLLYSYKNNNVNTKFVKGDTYYVKVIILTGNNPTYKYLSESISFVAGTPSTTGSAVTDEGKAQAQAAYDDAYKAAIATGSTEEEAQKQAFEASQGVGNEKPSNSQSGGASMPPCGITSGEKIMGCIGQAIYYVIFVPTSYFFALAGIFFDNTFAYSVQDTSYRSAFVTEGWGLVRDFCNMFFIFILLYTAIATILNLHGANAKQTIVRVIIIGLFINFSLFVTQVIVDASNITARVFYNADTIKITKPGQSDNNLKNATEGGTILAKEDSNGVISLSEGLVNKVNPQNLIINSTEINKIESKSDGSNVSNQDVKNIDTGTFIMVTLLASAVNIVGFIVFLSVGLIFVSRIVGLWIAMILSPLAFFTYILPSMEGTDTIGWKNWWSNTLKMSFLAPVFIFFLYIILKFLEINLWKDISGSSGAARIIATILPFAFIMVLLMKAKDIATKMSGEMGQKITGAVAATGGVILGGAALGTAALGRRFIGGTLAKASAGNTTTQKYADALRLKNRGDTSAWDKLNWRQKAAGAAGTFVGLNAAYGKVARDPNGNRVVVGGVGKIFNKKQKHIGDIDHARHEIDEAKKSAGLEGVTNLSAQDEQKLKTTFAKNKRSDVEANVRKGNDGKKDILIDGQKGDEAWKRANRASVESDYIAEEIRNGRTGLTSAGLDDKDKKNIENKLNSEYNSKLKTATDKEINHIFEHLQKEAKETVGMFERGFARANKASFDVRNLSQIKADKREGLFTKIPTALIAGVAMGVRSGLKSSGVNQGQGQKNFAKDFGSLITDALKGIKVEVPKPSGGGGGGHDSHGGGGHGGGGHH